MKLTGGDPLVDAVEAPGPLLRRLLPTKEEAILLCHARRVNVDDRELAAGDSDGWFAVVMANRLPAAGAPSPRLPGLARAAHRPGTGRPMAGGRRRARRARDSAARAAAHAGRSPPTARTPGGGSFRELAVGLDSGLAGTGAAGLTDTGHVPLTLHDRSGSEPARPLPRAAHPAPRRPRHARPLPQRRPGPPRQPGNRHGGHLLRGGLRARPPARGGRPAPGPGADALAPRGLPPGRALERRRIGVGPRAADGLRCLRRAAPRHGRARLGHRARTRRQRGGRVGRHPPASRPRRAPPGWTRNGWRAPGTSRPRRRSSCCAGGEPRAHRIEPSPAMLACWLHVSGWPRPKPDERAPHEGPVDLRRGRAARTHVRPGPARRPTRPCPDLPPYALAFLAHLRLLVGVPFAYLVPDPLMLPNESIRFFHLDRSWTDRLVDGVLAVGKIGTREQAHHQTAARGHRGAARRGSSPTCGPCSAGSASIEDQAATAEARTPGQPITGLLLRSALVSGWPHMDVAAYADGRQAHAAAAGAARAVVLIALFAGIPDRVSARGAPPRDPVRRLDHGRTARRAAPAPGRQAEPRLGHARTAGSVKTAALDSRSGSATTEPARGRDRRAAQAAQSTRPTCATRPRNIDDPEQHEGMPIQTRQRGVRGRAAAAALAAGLRRRRARHASGPHPAAVQRTRARRSTRRRRARRRAGRRAMTAPSTPPSAGSRGSWCPSSSTRIVLRAADRRVRRLPHARARPRRAGAPAAAAAAVRRPGRARGRAGVYLHWALPDALTHQRPGAARHRRRRCPRCPTAGSSHGSRSAATPGPPPGGKLGDRGQRRPAARDAARATWTESGHAAHAGPRTHGARPRRPRLVGVLRQRRRPAGLPRSARRRRGPGRSPTSCAAGTPTPGSIPLATRPSRRCRTSMPRLGRPRLVTARRARSRSTCLATPALR